MQQKERKLDIASKLTKENYSYYFSFKPSSFFSCISYCYLDDNKAWK